MQLFELEHMGRRRLAALRDILQSRYPQIDIRQVAMDCGIKTDWSQATTENRSLQAALRALTLLRNGPVPDIALQLGDQAQITDSGLLGYAVLTAPTVLQAARITSHALNQSNYLLRNKIVMSGEHARTVFTVAGSVRGQSELILENEYDRSVALHTGYSPRWPRGDAELRHLQFSATKVQRALYRIICLPDRIQ